MCLHGLAGGVLILATEVLIAKINPLMFLKVRVLYDILVIVGAYFCGRITDKVKRLLIKKYIHLVRKYESVLVGQFIRKVPICVIKSIAAGISLSLYKIPLYIFSARIFGVSWGQIRLAAGLYLIENMATGWLYILILDRTRRRFATKSTTDKP